MSPSDREIEEWILKALQEAGEAGKSITETNVVNAVKKVAAASVSLPSGSVGRCLAALVKRGVVDAPDKGTARWRGGKGQEHRIYRISPSYKKQS